MGLKIVGVILIISACGGFGFKIAASYIKEEKYLRQFIQILNYMESELCYRLAPLPNLCRQASYLSDGSLSRFFLNLANELDDQLSPDVAHCIRSALESTENIPSKAYCAIELLENSLGKFDIDGQIKGLESVRNECNRHLEELTQNRDIRLRNYQTLGLCAGAALAILLI